MFHRTLVVTVAREADRFNPADRIEAVDIAIKPDNAVIRSWDSAATIYSTINAGTVQLTGTQTGTGSATVGTPSTAPIAASLTGGYTQSEARTENFTATQQAESLTVSLKNNDPFVLSTKNPNELRIHRQGGIGVDLTGNVIVKVDIAIPENWSGSMHPLKASRRWLYSVKGDYFDKHGARVKPNSLTLKSTTGAGAEARPATGSIADGGRRRQCGTTADADHRGGQPDLHAAPHRVGRRHL